MGMTLDEAILREIKHAHSFRRRIENKEAPDTTILEECEAENLQIAELLKELKAYKEERVGCEYCKHNYREQHERPCSLCKRNFMDMFEREVNADD